MNNSSLQTPNNFSLLKVVFILFILPIVTGCPGNGNKPKKKRIYQSVQLNVEVYTGALPSGGLNCIDNIVYTLTPNNIQDAGPITHTQAFSQRNSCNFTQSFKNIKPGNWSIKVSGLASVGKYELSCTKNVTNDILIQIAKFQVGSSGCN